MLFSALTGAFLKAQCDHFLLSNINKCLAILLKYIAYLVKILKGIVNPKMNHLPSPFTHPPLVKNLF